VIAKYEAHHAIGTKARLCFALGKYTGAGRTEITRIGPQHIGDGEIIIPPRQKTGVPATLPLHPELRAIIEATPLIGTKSFLGTSAGKPYLPNNLSDRFRVWCSEAEIPKQYSLHGLRHAMGDLLAELGASPNEIAAVLAHGSVKSALHYTQGADRKRMARNTMARVIGGTKQGCSGNIECLGDNPTQTIDVKKTTEIK
jgi:integrase